VNVDCNWVNNATQSYYYDQINISI
jgi:hypothetical protein